MDWKKGGQAERRWRWNQSLEKRQVSSQLESFRVLSCCSHSFGEGGGGGKGNGDMGGCGGAEGSEDGEGGYGGSEVGDRSVKADSG